jgi:hypothetical protein
MDGIEAAKLMSMSDSKIPIVLFTILGSEGMESVAKDAGIHAIVSKTEAWSLIPQIENLVRHEPPRPADLGIHLRFINRCRDQSDFFETLSFAIGSISTSLSRPAGATAFCRGQGHPPSETTASTRFSVCPLRANQDPHSRVSRLLSQSKALCVVCQITMDLWNTS